MIRLLYWFGLCVFALSPMYIFRFSLCCTSQGGAYPTTVLEVGLVLFVLFSVGYAYHRRRSRLLPPAAFVVSGVVVSVVSLLAVLYSSDLRGGLGIWKAYFVEPVLFSFCLALFIRTREALRAVLSVYVVSATFLAGWGLLQVFGGVAVVSTAEAGLARAHALFNSANALALFIGPAFFVGFGLVGEYSRHARPFLFGALGVLLLGMYATQSQGGMGALVGIVLIFLLVKGLVQRFPRIFWVWWVIVPLSVMVQLYFVLLVLPHYAPYRANPWDREGMSTAEVRLCLWEGTAELLHERPLIGAGLSGFKELYAHVYATCDAEPLEYPHQLFLTFWAELGALGLLVMTACIAGLLGLLHRSHDRLAPFLMSAFLMWGVHGLVDVPYFKNDLSLLFWVLALCSVLLVKFPRYSSASSS